MTTDSDRFAASGLARLDVRELGRAMAAAETDPTEIAAALVTRIEAVDPTLHAMISVDPGAVSHPGRRAAGPLAGIPVLVKDNVDTVGPMGTTAGSTLLTGDSPARDAPIVTAIRRAGGAVLGKTNLSQWANYRSTHSSSGWSSVGGLCVNPHALDRSAGGSSSGSAAAVAAGLAPLAVGTETDGSICCPAALCGVVGIKPTVGLVPTTGIVPIASSQDTAGAIARTVYDAALLLGLLAASADLDTGATAQDRRAHADYTVFCPQTDLTGLRIGLPRKGLWGYSPAADDAAERAVGVLAELGATVVDGADLPSITQIDRSQDEGTVLRTEFAVLVERYLATRTGSGPRTLAELIEGNRTAAAVELAHFGQELFEAAAETNGRSDRRCRDARRRSRRRGRAQGIDAALAAHGLDALVVPTYSPAWKIDLVNGDQVPGGCSTPSAIAGYPIVTVPSGMRDGLPVGVAFLGTAWSEPTLIRLAAAFESRSEGAVRPAYRLPATG